MSVLPALSSFISDQCSLGVPSSLFRLGVAILYPCPKDAANFDQELTEIHLLLPLECRHHRPAKELTVFTPPPF
ncbi:hypothetical protein ACRRTK_016769 [Alexandromys fortis]